MEEETEKHVYLQVKSIPDFAELNDKVKGILRSCSWLDLFGYDWLQFTWALICLPLGLYILGHNGWQCQLFGSFLLTCYHTCLTARAAHLASHGSLAFSKRWNQFWLALFGEFLGSFSAKCTHDVHIKYHHPYTNVIGLGDSSTWKAPFLSTYVYMFFAPLALPALAPIVSVQLLIEGGHWRHLFKFCVIFPISIAFHLALLMYVSGFTLYGAALVLYIYRAGLSIPYVHINIFQHIGLSMYSLDDRPPRIYQMASGCMNLWRNVLLDFNFGHSLVSCHVEHHLFPKLSDNMCLKVKPIVRAFLTSHGLPYQERSYSSRLAQFLDQYEKLMVHAPPITHLVGIQ